MDLTHRKAIHDALVRLADGDRAAFAVVLEDLWPLVLRFVERSAGRGADAEDIAQEVFLKICARISDFDRRRDALSWVFGIASYEVMTHRRRRQRRREVHDESSVATRVDDSATQEESLLRGEMLRAFEEIVGSLDDDDRRALGLERSSSAENAPAATLRKRKQRALDRLRGLWRRVYGDA